MSTKINAIDEREISVPHTPVDVLGDRTGLHYSDWSETTMNAKKPKPMLVDGLIPVGAITLLVGESDTGKSLLALQLALCVCSNQREFLGLPICAKHKKV